MVSVLQPRALIHPAVRPHHLALPRLLVVKPLPLVARPVLLHHHVEPAQGGVRRQRPFVLPRLLVAALPLPRILIQLLQGFVVGHARARLDFVAAGSVREDQHAVRRLPVGPLPIKLHLVCPRVYSMPILHVISIFPFVLAAVCKRVHARPVHLVFMVHTHVSAPALERCRPLPCALPIQPLALVSPPVRPCHDSKSCLRAVHVLPLIPAARRPCLKPTAVFLVLFVFPLVPSPFRPDIHAFAMHLVQLIFPFVSPPILVR
mmetsp:Transcript_51752/g.105331  ORF Transcript_51752/g.105331 Transcript_51752/m.105331 type:complete len:261 (-) Transcript_51752:5-787(-)